MPTTDNISDFVPGMVPTVDPAFQRWMQQRPTPVLTAQKQPNFAPAAPNQFPGER
jgi:hypothetical protein